METTKIDLSNGLSFIIKHNLPIKGSVDTLESALDCWLARTKKITGKSFVDYINSKKEISGYKAELIN